MEGGNLSCSDSDRVEWREMIHFDVLLGFYYDAGFLDLSLLGDDPR